jgi:hypothetical protein
MSDVAYGIVKKISGKPTKNGGTIYNICLDEDGQETWFGYGFEEPNFNEGAEIEFDIAYKGKYTNVAEGTVDVIKDGEAPRGRSSGRDSGGGRGAPARGGGGRSSAGRGDSGRSSGGRGAPAPAARHGGAARSAPAEKGGVDWERKDNLIRLQSSQNTAIAMVNMLLQNDAIKLPAKASAKYDAALALVEKEAARLFKKYDAVADGTYDPAGDGPEDDEDGGDEDYPE